MTLDPTPRDAVADAGVGAEIDRLERQFGLLFDDYRQRIKRQSAELDAGLQPSGYRTVVALVTLGPSGAGPLAEFLGFDKSVLSRQLHQLEELGLVARAQDPADRRAVIISATPEAVERVESMHLSARDEFRTRLAAWDRRDLDDLVRLLAKLSSS